MKHQGRGCASGRGGARQARRCGGGVVVRCQRRPNHQNATNTSSATTITVLMMRPRPSSLAGSLEDPIRSKGLVSLVVGSITVAVALPRVLAGVMAYTIGELEAPRLCRIGHLARIRHGAVPGLHGCGASVWSPCRRTRITKESRATREPSKVSETLFRADRLKTMRMRLSAAYKGVNALLMKEGAQDFRSGQKFDHIVFFGENVDIHHIFPQDWCKRQGIKPCLRFHHQQDAIVLPDELDYRRCRAFGVRRQVRKGQ